jgi:hypothetical protein
MPSPVDTIEKAKTRSQVALSPESIEFPDLKSQLAHSGQSAHRKVRGDVVAEPSLTKNGCDLPFGLDSLEMLIPDTDSPSNMRSDRESDHRMLIDAGSRASSMAAASLP